MIISGLSPKHAPNVGARRLRKPTVLGRVPTLSSVLPIVLHSAALVRMLVTRCAHSAPAELRADLFAELSSFLTSP